MGLLSAVSFLSYIGASALQFLVALYADDALRLRLDLTGLVLPGSVWRECRSPPSRGARLTTWRPHASRRCRASLLLAARSAGQRTITLTLPHTGSGAPG
jgi:hypothetical protein